MGYTASISGLAEALDEAEGAIAKTVTAAMRAATDETKAELRDQVRSSGLGARLANTWRGEVYPERRNSLTPAGYIHSNAPDIVDGFLRGATIVPIHGSRYLAIPTKNVPRSRGRGNRKKMTPFEVEIEFNQDLFFKRGRGGRVLAFINAAAARSGRGFRQATPGLLSHGRAEKPVLMFVLVRSARLPKLLDIEGPARRFADRFAAYLERGV